MNRADQATHTLPALELVLSPRTSVEPDTATSTDPATPAAATTQVLLATAAASTDPLILVSHILR